MQERLWASLGVEIVHLLLWCQLNSFLIKCLDFLFPWGNMSHMWDLTQRITQGEHCLPPLVSVVFFYYLFIFAVPFCHPENVKICPIWPVLIYLSKDKYAHSCHRLRIALPYHWWGLMGQLSNIWTITYFPSLLYVLAHQMFYNLQPFCSPKELLIIGLHNSFGGKW